MNIETLFCTPEQGRRLKELVPELTSSFVWAGIGYRRVYRAEYASDHYTYYAPALTLQELRDVAKKAAHHTYTTMLQHSLWRSTAPELAAWVIERLEEVGNVRR